MRKGKTYILVTVLLVAVIALAGILAACGGSDDDRRAPAPAHPQPAAIEGSAMERATAILGHEPTGLAAEIVTAGEVIVANDSELPAAELRRPRRPTSSWASTSTSPRGWPRSSASASSGSTRVGDHPRRPADNGRYDVSIGSMTSRPSARRPSTSRDPYYYTSGQVFVKKGGTQITGVDDLAGKTVGVGAATTYYDFLKANTDGRRQDVHHRRRRLPGPPQRQPRLRDDRRPHRPAGHPRGQGHASSRASRSTTRTSRSRSRRARPTGSRCSPTPSQQMHEDGALTEMSQAVVQRHRPDGEGVVTASR